MKKWKWQLISDMMKIVIGFGLGLLTGNILREYVL